MSKEEEQSMHCDGHRLCVRGAGKVRYKCRCPDCGALHRWHSPEDGETLLWCHMCGRTYKPSQNDLLATDWEVVE
jgi:uncharacterized C2H2 Zn-finger protein